MSVFDNLRDRLMDLSMAYARQGAGVPERWYRDRAALRTDALAAGDRAIVTAVDALPGASCRSPYWIL